MQRLVWLSICGMSLLLDSPILPWNGYKKAVPSRSSFSGLLHIDHTTLGVGQKITGLDFSMQVASELYKGL